MCMALRMLDMLTAFAPPQDEGDTYMVQWQPECVVPGQMCQAAVHPSKVEEFLNAMAIYEVRVGRRCYLTKLIEGVLFQGHNSAGKKQDYFQDGVREVFSFLFLW